MKSKPEEEPSKHLLTKEVVGTTFKVYLYLLKAKSSSARGVYRTLDMSSPWLATYHLDKLHELELVKKDSNGIYYVNPKRFGMLNFFIVAGGWIIPRTFFYSLFFLSASIYFLLCFPANLNLTLSIFALIPTIVNLAESVLFYKTLSKSFSEK